ncbi:MAG: MBOAT family protein [Leptolyngbya sp. SIO1E4]|nr:MBOAT family protein [Leptolyngbya sp. SIO1E4]
MLFNSYEFIVFFLPICALGFFRIAATGKTRQAVIWLLVVSLFFYGYWNPPYLLLLLVSTLGNFIFGRFLLKSDIRDRTASFLLWSGIIFNLGILGYYKYASFFISSLNGIIGANLPTPEILLPLGISFYSFTQIAYLVDAYKGEVKTQYDWVSYSLFVTFFPQLIAGPILRHNELIPELQDKKTFRFLHENLARGLVLFILGLSKKVLIADSLSPWVALTFDNAHQLSFMEAWVASLSYTFQLYFDFSGYSDMAIGLGWIFNINLPWNFNSPYKAVSIIDFWRRWHITLSHFLRDYLYIPLGGSRKGELRRYGNLLITMLLGGLWHGAGWTFVIWGGMHGTYLCINHAWRKLNLRLPSIVGWLLTFLAVVASWVVFRAATLRDAVAILKAMAGFNGVVLSTSFQTVLPWLTETGLIEFRNSAELPYLPPNYRVGVMTLLMLTIVVTRLPNTTELMKAFRPSIWWTILISLLTTASLLSLNRVSEFLYFQF